MAGVTVLIYVAAFPWLMSVLRDGGLKDKSTGVEQGWVFFLSAWALIWAVGPPIWFWAEYYYVFLSSKGARSERAFEGLKHGQQLSTAIWAGLLLAQGFILSQLL